MKTITLECPEPLHRQLETLVGAGGFRDADEVVLEALRRYLDSHPPDLQREQILRDVEWGLHGRD